MKVISIRNTKKKCLHKFELKLETLAKEIKKEKKKYIQTHRQLVEQSKDKKALGQTNCYTFKKKHRNKKTLFSQCKLREKII